MKHINITVDEQTLARLARLGERLGLDRSSTIRLLVNEREESDPVNTTFDTSHDAQEAGYVSVQSARNLCQGSGLDVVDTSGPQYRGYSYAVKRGDDVVARTVSLWFRHGRNKAGGEGSFDGMFRRSDIPV